nr:carbohydrate ABC transporter permease [Hungatella sp. L36]
MITTIFPLYFAILSSFKDDQTIFADFFALPQRFGLDNYISAEKMVHILRATANSLLLSAGSICLMLGVSIMGAYVTARKRIPGSEGVTLFLIAAMMIPIQSAIVPIVQMVSAIGQRNNLFVLMVIYAGINLSMVFFILKGYIEGIPKELDEAAMIDGASLFQTLLRVIVPVAKPALSTCAITSFLFIYNELPIANVLITKPQLKPISVALLNLKGDFGTLYAVSFASIVISIIPTVVFYLIAQEKVESSICSGVVKG